MLSSLELCHFRLFDALNISFDAPKIYLCGSNGQGKTTLLEAIYYLANLRSFRTLRAQEMIAIHQPDCFLAASVSFSGWKQSLRVHLGAERHLSIDGQHIARASDFTDVFHTITFLPEDLEIVTGRAALRRRTIDMFISMLDREYFQALQMYANGIRNRNFLLKQENANQDVLRSFHGPIADCGSQIIRKRRFYVKMMSDFLSGIIAELKPELSDLSLRMKCIHELADADAYHKRLDASIEHDKLYGYTSFGPHLDDFDFLADGKSLHTYGSRGQCRAAAFSLKSAQFEISRKQESLRDNTVVLVDDATGDFDRKTEDAFYQRISSAKQIFCTFTENPDRLMGSDVQLFHITAGRAIPASA